MLILFHNFACPSTSFTINFLDVHRSACNSSSRPHEEQIETTKTRIFNSSSPTVGSSRCGSLSQSCKLDEPNLVAMGLGLQQQQQLHTFSRFPGPRAHQFGLATSAAQSAPGARRLTRFPKGRIVASLGESSSSKSSSFWQPFWNIGANSGTSSSSSSNSGGGGGGGLGFNGAGSGGGRNGNGDGDGKGGGFESSGEDIFLNAAVVDIKESEDEDKPPDFRTAGLASLSSAAGEALDGEAPFGDVLLGRNHRRTVETPASKWNCT